MTMHLTLQCQIAAPPLQGRSTERGPGQERTTTLQLGILAGLPLQGPDQGVHDLAPSTPTGSSRLCSRYLLDVVEKMGRGQASASSGVPVITAPPHVRGAAPGLASAVCRAIDRRHRERIAADQLDPAAASGGPVPGKDTP